MNGFQLEYYTQYNMETIYRKQVHLICPESVQYHRENSNLKAYKNIWADV